jgi:hypothetical protein
LADTVLFHLATEHLLSFNPTLANIFSLRRTLFQELVTADKNTPPKNPHKVISSDFGENPVEKLGIASISMNI